MEDRKVTIYDVARRAGVSKGTVDRVLHNRGEVSPKSAEKVRRAIAELDYHTNLFASLLASRKNRTIACLLPSFSHGEFWEQIHRGFVSGGEDLSSLGVTTEVFTYDQYDREAFLKACASMLESNPSGVVLPTLFKDDTVALADELMKRSIPYVFVDTKLEGTAYLAYFGMPMYKSGYLCASLLTERCSPADMEVILVVRILRDKAGQSDPTVERRKGFNDFIAEHFPKCRVDNVFIDPSDPDSIEKTLSAYFSVNAGVRYVVMFNSRIHLIAPFLAAHPCAGRRVIGFDALEDNIKVLKDGSIDILIAQHAEEQSRSAVTVLSDFILKGRHPRRKDFHMHMDILTGLNIEDY